MVKLVRLQHLGVKSSVGRSLSRSAVRREFVRIGDEGGGPSGHQMDRIHGGNISPARQFMRLRSGSVGSDTVRLGLPKKGTPADYLNEQHSRCVSGLCGYTNTDVFGIFMTPLCCHTSKNNEGFCMNQSIGDVCGGEFPDNMCASGTCMNNKCA